MQSNWKTTENILKNGGVAVVPTDTLYGIVASAFDKKAVERVYKIRGRNPKKPCIILISSFGDLKKFGVNLSPSISKIFKPKVSVILPINTSILVGKYLYLHRGTKSLALRMIGPRNKNLFNLIKKIGPLIAPSANPEGLPPAFTIKQAKNYFGNKVDVYLSVGTRKSKPSRLIKLQDGKIIVLR